MKKLIFFAALLLTTAFTACEKEEVGGTATESLAGQWYVTVDAADSIGNVVEGFEDPFGKGRILMLTSNTAANIPSEMLLNDLGGFWDFNFKISVAPGARTFKADSVYYNDEMRAIAQEIADSVAKQAPVPVDGSGNPLVAETATVTGGKILPMAGKQNNGSPADSIVFYISFSDDPYPGTYGYVNYRISGIRYSGLAENN